MPRNICQIEALTLLGDTWLGFLWQNLVYNTSWHFRMDNKCSLHFCYRFALNPPQDWCRTCALTLILGVGKQAVVPRISSPHRDLGLVLSANCHPVKCHCRACNNKNFSKALLNSKPETKLFYFSVMYIWVTANLRNLTSGKGSCASRGWKSVAWLGVPIWLFSYEERYL